MRLVTGDVTSSSAGTSLNLGMWVAKEVDAGSLLDTNLTSLT